MVSKLTDLPKVNSVSNDAVFVVENDVAGSPTTSGITATNLFGNISVNTSISASFTVNGSVSFSSSNTTISNLHITYGDTPSNSSISVLKGKIWFDEDYLYVATANNNLKRVSLTSF